MFRCALRARIVLLLRRDSKKRRAAHNSARSVPLRTPPLRFALRHCASHSATALQQMQAAAPSSLPLASAFAPLAPFFASLAPFFAPLAPFFASLRSAPFMRCAANPFQAHPPKTFGSLSKGGPSPYSGMPYRALIKIARSARFAVGSLCLARASASALLVYNCIQVFTSVSFSWCRENDCISARCVGRVYGCNQLVTAVTSCLRYCRNHLLQP